MTSPPDPTVKHEVAKVAVGAAPEHETHPALARPTTDLARRLGRVRIWHVNSTPTGGGVAELLWSSIAHEKTLGLPVSWLTADAEPEFFLLTKRIHHGLHGRAITPFDRSDEQLYRAATAKSARQLTEHIRAGDVVLLHDPQTVGIALPLLEAGVRVGWRCHIGTRANSAHADATWEFLRPYLQPVPRFVFTLRDYAPHYLQPDRISIIMPSINPTTAKNRELLPQQRDELLTGIGLFGSRTSSGVGATIQDQPLPTDVPLITQVSRWDPLKDMTGVLRAFTEWVPPPAHLLLVGPDPADIPDDPEGAAVFTEVCHMREQLDAPLRNRIHLAVLSLKDMTANSLVVNAIQRRSTVVVQKSLQEGFGLTVTEAMWKARPIVAAAVGGLLTQLTDRRNGLLINPLDLQGFGAAVNELLAKPYYADALGAAARRTCEERFLTTRELCDYLDLYSSLLDTENASAAPLSLT
jgi:trehalose synthase